MSIYPPDQFAGYYHGIPSRPKLIARSDPSEWTQPRSKIDSGYPRKKIIRPVDSSHPICSIWKSALGPQLLKKWIGIPPESISIARGEELVTRCETLLRTSGLVDVQVEIRESQVISLSGAGPGREPKPNPKLILKEPPIYTCDDVTYSIISKLSTAIGLGITTPISRKSDSYGTTSFHLENTKEEGNFYALTARHVVSYFEFDDTDVPVPIPVVLCNHLFEECMEQIEYLIRKNQEEVDKARVDMDSIDVGKNESLIRRAKYVLDYNPLDIQDLEELRRELVDQWSQESQRRIGIVRYHPPINYDHKAEVDVDLDVDHGRGLNDWGDDWALIKLDRDKLPCSTTLTNIIDLNDRSEFKMASWSTEQPLLKIDRAGMLRLKNILTEDDMEKSSLAVIMRGAKNGIRLGQSMSVFSMVRYPYPSKKWIKQWPITTMNEWEFQFRKSPTFADQGDSGAGVVSRDGKFGGIVVGGTGRATRDGSRAIIDITCVMPMFHIMDRITELGLGDLQLL
ncbi:uncharacterized protein L199_001790 [Kwoniella botswanensis]|uniref:uncharacterized protein n=1 Tax=Kwoniella botswanensis TaxID=1268659 RepID=UPI00315CFABD